MNEKIWWIPRLIAAGILAQTLWFKFTGAPEAIYIFTTLGIEPWGRFLVASLEALTVIGLLITPLVAVGALLGIGLMVGALFSHVTKLGVVVQNDGGLLFILAVVVLLLSMIIAWHNRRQIHLWRQRW